MPCEYLKIDPQPWCEHEWRAKGWTTIIEPPIAHSVCFKCRTFKHVSQRLEWPGLPTKEEETRYSKEWMYPDNWDWEKEKG